MATITTATSSLITANPDTTIVNLKEKIVYVFYMEDTERWFAKICSINKLKTAKPTNKTAAMLLYLLAREVGYGILLRDFIELVQGKFNDPENPVDESKIRDFLSKLDLAPNRLLDINVSQLDNTPDPVNLFDPDDKKNWEENPDITFSKPPTCGNSTIYNTGSIVFTIPRGWP
jgi:hypothetical protein